MTKNLFILTSLSGAIAVIAGAFGAHGLKDHISAPLLAAYQTGVYYQLFHTVALLALLALMHTTAGSNERVPTSSLRNSAFLWLGGIVLFSGSLYGLALGGPFWLGPITPIGGLLLIAGWLNITIAAYRS